MSDVPREIFERIVSSVSRPSCYLGTERNAVRKDPAEIDGSMALVFPDRYDIGMSHLGLKILYHIINAQPGLAAERAFAPGEDFAEAIRREGAPLMSLESKRPLAGFDVVGFTIPYELSYTTILWILDLAGIPLRAADRDESYPLIVGGGAGVYNPEPLAPFFDLFVLGDGEELALAILREAIAARGKRRRDTLIGLAKIPGVYVPSLYDITHKEDGTIDTIRPAVEGLGDPSRVSLSTLGESPFPVDMVVPFGRPVHDRLNVEIDRGCTQGCRFCQAGTTYRPARERTPDEIIGIFEEGLKRTGYEEISLTSLSAGDYTHLAGLLENLMDRYAHERVSVSLPSMRPGTVTGRIVGQIKRVRRTGFTIAAEAATPRLRAVLNKKVTDDEIMATAQRLLQSGWRSLKLYFMIGLPTETDEDIEAIHHLAQRLDRLKVEGRRFQKIAVSVSNCVPKAHTAFQWIGQDTIDTLAAKKERLFELIKPDKRLRLKWHNAKMSHLEAAFSRGDRRLGAVIEEAYRRGARFDAWTEHFDFSRWMEAFNAVGLDSSWYACRDIARDETLPWDHIDTGLTKKYFLKELDLAKRGEMTEDCKFDTCIGCGLNPKTCFEPYEWMSGKNKEAAPPPATGERFRYRLMYLKQGWAKFLSQRELQLILFRALRIAGVPLAYSKGFSPHPKVSFGLALPVGVESADERVDIELTEPMDPSCFSEKLNVALPEGIRFIGAEAIPAGARAIAASVSAAEYLIELDNELDHNEINGAVERLQGAESAIVENPRKGKAFDIRPMIDSIAANGERHEITYTTVMSGRGLARPDDLLGVLFPGRSVRARRMVKLKTAFDAE